MSPDRTAFVFADPIDRLSVCDFPSGQQRFRLDRPKNADESDVGRVTDIDWSCESQILVARDDGILRAYDPDDGQLKWDAEFDDPIQNVWQGSDGKWIAAMTHDKKIHCSTGFASKFSPLDGVKNAVAIAFAAPNQMAVLSGTDELLSIEFPSRVTRYATVPQQSKFTALACTTDLIATGQADGSVSLWDAATGNRKIHWSEGPTARFAARSIQSKVAAAQASLDLQIRRFDATKSRIAAADSRLNEAKKGKEEAQKQKLDAQRKRDEIAATIKEKENESEEPDSDDAELKKLRESLAAAEMGFEKATSSLKERDEAVAKSSEQLTQIQREMSSVTRLKQRRENRLRSIKDQQSRLGSSNHRISSLAFSSCGKTLVAYRYDGSILNFDVAKGLCVDEFHVGRVPNAEAAIVCHPKRSGLQCLLLSDQAGSARLIPIERAWTLVRTIGTSEVGSNDHPLIDDRVASLDFSVDGRYLAVGSGTPSRSGKVSIVDVATGNALWESERLHSDTVLSVRFSPDGRTLASGAADKTIRITDVQAGRTVRALDGHTHHVLSLAWNHDGQTLVSGSADETIKVWDVTNGIARRTIGGFGGEVTSVEFTAPSAQVVSTSTSGQVRVHDIASGRQTHASGVPSEILFAGKMGKSGKSDSLFFAVGQSGNLHAWKAETLEKQ